MYFFRINIHVSAIIICTRQQVLLEDVKPGKHCSSYINYVSEEHKRL